MNSTAVLTKLLSEDLPECRTVRTVQPATTRNSEVCLEAVRTLQIVARQLVPVNAGNRRFLMAWVKPLDDTYVKLLAEKDDITMAVYAHFLVYVILLEELWWVGDLGQPPYEAFWKALGICPCCEWCSKRRRQSWFC